MLNEVMYHPAGNDSDLEWVELFNALSYDMDISEWELDGGIEYTFPEGTIIPADGYLVVAKSPAALEAATGLTDVFGPFDGQLSNGGETIRLENNSNRNMDELDYKDSGAWPIAADGSGVSLAKKAPLLVSGKATSWHAGAMGGTPGGSNFATEISSSQQTLLARDSVWKYRDLGTDPGGSWMQTNYSDSGWAAGPAELGYGDGDESTVVSFGPNGADKYPTTYFRHQFTVDSPSDFSSISLNTVVDDGAVFYVNGTEISPRVRMAAGPVSYLDYSSESVGTPGQGVWDTLGFSPTLLVDGQNVLAVEVHQSKANSSDVSFNAEIIAFIETQTTNDTAQLLDASELIINEIQGLTNSSWWIELKNESGAPLEIGGYILSAAGDPAREYEFASQVVPVGGHILVAQAQLGFSMQDEEPLFLYRPGKASVADARTVEFSLRGKTGDAWLRPASATPGASNHFEFTTDIVMNEIMYHHQATNDGVTYAESDVAWVELYNRGTSTISLEGWKFDDGISYDFPLGSSLAPDSYLVVSNFSGSLSGRGERLRLVDASGNPADEVRYFDGGRWPKFADGGGGSLELRDPFADNSVAEAWASSDETSKSPWKTYSYEGVASASVVAGGLDDLYAELVLGLLDDGEVLLDDISVIEDPYGAATELISTGDFEGGVGDWRIIGNHRRSEVVTDPDNSGNQALKLVSSGSTEHMHNHAEITLDNGETINNGKTYRISYRAKWIAGCRLLNTRFYFNRLSKTSVLDVPMNNGTPGAQNSTYASNIGPTFDGMRHDPIVPQVGEPVTISIQADDIQGVQDIKTWYSVNGGAWQSTAMTLGSDNLYAATLPAQAASAVVQFYVEAEDGNGAISMFPARGPEARALYKMDDGLGDANLHNFRIIMTAADADFLDTDIQLMSNEQLGATVIFDERDIYYDVGARYKGSEHGRVVDSRLGFRLNFHAEQPFNGVHQSIAIDRSASQKVSAREMLINVAMNRGGGVLSKYTDLIKVIAPKVEHASPAELYLSRYNDVFLDAQFKNGGDGGVFEYELVYPLKTANEDGYKLPVADGGVKGSAIKGLGEDKEDYRHNFMIKNHRGADDYSPWINFAKIMGLSGDAFNEQIGDVCDVDQWLRYMAYAIASGHADNYSSGSKHNGFFYFRPSDGRALFFPHDMDLGFSATRDLVLNADLEKMIGTPERERLYYAHMWDILESVYNVDYMQFWTDQLGALIPTENFASYLTFIGQRHDFLVGEIEKEVAPKYPFSVSGAPVVGTLSTTVSGDGWLDVDKVYLDGVDETLALTWTSTGSGTSLTYQWSAEVPLEPGENTLTFYVYNFQGDLIDTKTIVITSTATGDPLKDHLRVTEIMHTPEGGSDYEFLELFNSGTETLDLTGVYFSSGIEFNFTTAGFTSLAPQTHCVLVKDLAAFSSRYNTSGMNLAGEYSGKLSDGETLEILGSLNEELLKFEYRSSRGWPLTADGCGHSLVPRVGSWSDDALYYGGNWRASSSIGGSPGQADVASESSLWINEVVAHTDYSNPAKPEYDSNDQIELYNSSTNAITLNGDWYLSDDAEELTKWAIPASTEIPAKGHLTFYEVTDFHSPITEGFGLDKAGEQVYLSYLPMVGNRYVADAIRFRGQENGASIGRYEDGTSEWYALTPTPNSTNEKPALRPVIAEIMFHPPGVVTNNTADEYVELLNPADAPVALWNEVGPWRVTGGIDYDFPTNTMLNAEETILLVSFDPADSAARAAFLATYRLSEGEVNLMGPFSSSLDNRGERIALERPQDGDLPGESVSWVIVDEVIYFHQTPWPVGADGTGNSLQRKYTRWDGNNPENWFVGQNCTPGKNVPVFGSQKVPEFWFADANPAWTNNLSELVDQDSDNGGASNGDEYVAGTDPMTGADIIYLDLNSNPEGWSVGFDTLKATRTCNGLERYYSLLQSSDLISDPLTNRVDSVRGTDRYEEIPIDTSTDHAGFYRLYLELDEARD